MKKFIFATVVILALVALVVWGNRLVEYTLDAKLAPLLTRQLGLPVHLSPISANLWQLQASSGKLIMGDPQDPAVVATDVAITLAWSDLLDRKIRLVRVSAVDLMVRPSRWPARTTPLPAEYLFLDPWLPRNLQLENGQYVNASGDIYPIAKLLWQRQTNGSATANWSEARTAGEVTVQAQVNSLSKLLELAPLQLELAVAVTGKPDSAIALKASIQPATASAYGMQIDLHAANLNAHIDATGETSWRLPDTSETTMPLLDTGQLMKVLHSYRESDPDDELAKELAATLPLLRLPIHRGHVVIDEIRVADELTQDTSFNFSSGDHGLQLSDLTSKGPTGILQGGLGVVSDDQGWTVDVDATMQAQETEKGVAADFVGSDWLWRTGRAKLTGRGTTWGTLLNALQGDIALAGDYRSAKPIPVSIEARLDNRPEEIALDSLAVKFGELHVSGSALLSGTDRRKLTLNLKGTQMDLGFLFDAKDIQPLPGLPLPQYLADLPDMDLNLAISVENLQAPGLSLGQTSASLERTTHGGKLIATAKGLNQGSLDLTLQANTPSNLPRDFQLTVNFSELDLPGIFRQQGILHSRSSGSLTFHGKGQGIKNIFTAMQGKANLAVEIRSDDNWRRVARAQEKLALAGNSSLMLDNDRIVGVKIEQLNIESIDQDLTGSLHMVTNRSPWLVADLESQRLNITDLLDLLPASTAQADEAGLVPSLTRLGAVQVALNANALTVKDMNLSQVQLKVASAPNVMTIKQFDFVSHDLTLKTQGNITWRNRSAKLESTAQVSNVDLDQFLIQHSDAQSVPFSGTVLLLSEGRKIDELISNATGHIDLQATMPQQNAVPNARRRLVVKATRVPDGVQADVETLQWGESELTGSVRYLRTSPPTLEVKLAGGTLSLLPWEKAYLSTDKKAPAQSSGTALGSLARASASLVGDILLSPLKFLTRSDETTPGDNVFSTDPLPLDALKKLNVNVSGQLDSLLSTAVTAKDLQFTGSLMNGQLAVQANSGQLSSGNGEISLDLNSNAVPPTFKLTSTFANVRGLVARDTFPRSGFISLESRGQSPAELAATASGLIFLDLGQGPFDYANSALLTANLATTLFQTLIPGINRQQHQLECGTVLGLFQNGQGSTPYGFAARTNQANLVGHLKVDLGKENLEMNIDSRGRQGMGISVGSVFSSTVQIRGSLTNPRMVPNPTGIAWRAWAAVSTGGLSILGETVLRRIWASQNPCTSVKRIIVEQLCPTNPIAASSEMVCPKT